jgi:hypothetical protein
MKAEVDKDMLKDSLYCIHSDMEMDVHYFKIKQYIFKLH